MKKLLEILWWPFDKVIETFCILVILGLGYLQYRERK